MAELRRAARGNDCAPCRMPRTRCVVRVSLLPVAFVWLGWLCIYRLGGFAFRGLQYIFLVVE